MPQSGKQIISIGGDKKTQLIDDTGAFSGSASPIRLRTSGATRCLPRADKYLSVTGEDSYINITARSTYYTYYKTFSYYNAPKSGLYKTEKSLADEYTTSVTYWIPQRFYGYTNYVTTWDRYYYAYPYLKDSSIHNGWAYKYTSVQSAARYGSYSTFASNNGTYGAYAQIHTSYVRLYEGYNYYSSYQHYYNHLKTNYKYQII